MLTATYTTEGRSGTARFTYDAPGNYALSDNDDARWLVGDVLPEPAAPARDDLQQVRERRLAAVPEELPLGGEAPSEALPLGAAYDVDQVLELPTEAEEPPAPAPLDEPIRATADEAVARDTEAERAKHRRPVQKKRGRASVPSWDEIMFGGADS